MIAVYIDGKKQSAAGVLQSVAVTLPITVADNTSYVVEQETTRYSSVLYFYPENQSRAQGVRHALVMDDWRGPAANLNRRLRIAAQGGSSYVTNETYVDNLSETLLTPQRTLTAQSTKRGYTLHEHLDNSGLVHMNARLYDPLMARFLSPDPVLAYPENPQDLNRYSYVWNGPLSAKDPSGECYYSVGNGVRCFSHANDVKNSVLSMADDAWRNGRYGSALIGYGLGSLQTVNMAVGFFSDAVLAPGNGSYNLLSGLREGDSSRAVGGGAELLLSLTMLKLGNPTAAAPRGAADTTRVGRWMSETEFNLMNQTGRVVEGAGGRTYVVNPANPVAFTGAGRGSSIYAEFNVPTNVLKLGSKPEWSVIPGPNVTTRLYGPAPAELAPATCIVCVIRNP